MAKKDWRRGRKSDSDETAKHVRPVEVEKSINAPEGAWVDVPRGMVAAPGTYVDKNGVLRTSEGGRVAVWHHRCKVGNHGPCERYTDDSQWIKAEEIIYVNGAPWCPDCLVKMNEDEKRKKMQELFRGQPEKN